MKFIDLYENSIERQINPAVSAGDMTDETVATEITEYVFTDDLLTSLSDVLGVIKNGTASHNGIWISGYFGSGKSHFMKFVDYCFSSKHGAKARERVAKAVSERDPLTSPVSPTDWTGLSNWLSSVSVDTLTFNMGAVSDAHSRAANSFLEVFWNQFNQLRGYNSWNITLAQVLEKPLDAAGKFDAFKEELKKQFGYDWKRDAYKICLSFLDNVLAVAQQVLPNLSIDIIKAHLKKGDYVVSVKSFTDELKEFVAEKAKTKDYRLVFCADEVSQFISSKGDLLLQLQEVVTGLHDACGEKVWLMCTAQEDLSELLSICHINKTSDDYGKIMGRYRRISLTGTRVDYITKKRILEKKDTVAISLRGNFKNVRAALAAQCQLPPGYETYADENDYAATYPFVGYQFKLVAQVFKGFQERKYVDTQVRDNARSVLNVTFQVAKDTKNDDSADFSKFISFDQFFRVMFSQGLVNEGIRAWGDAEDIAKGLDNPDMARRVLSVLFMICNLDVVTQQTFPASVENVTSLLVQDVTSPRLTLKQEVEKIVKSLCEKNVLQEIPAKGTLPVTYQFYTKDEKEVATAISGKTVDEGTMAEELKKIFSRLIGNLPPREPYHSRRFSIGLDILGRTFLSNNPDVKVVFLLDANGEKKDTVRLNNGDTTLCFFLADLYLKDEAFKNAFHWFCQTQIYLNNTPATSEARNKTNQAFREKANQSLALKIEPAAKRYLEACPVLSGTAELEVSATKPSDRYRIAMEKHLAHLYSHAAEVDDCPTDARALADKIRRQLTEGEYNDLNMTDAETTVESYLKVKPDDLAVTDVVDHFAKVPYGWNEFCTLHVLNELVRRGLREFAYQGQVNVGQSVVVDRLPKDQSRFAMRQKTAIPQTTIDGFVAAWKKIFGPTALSGTASHTSLEMKTTAQTKLKEEVAADGEAYAKVGGPCYPFAKPLKEEMDAFSGWEGIADEVMFFTTVAAAADAAATRRNAVNQVREFADSQFAKFRDDVVGFAAANVANAQFLGVEARGKFDVLASAKDDPTPFANLPNYLRLAKTVAAEFDRIRTEKRTAIASAYVACFDELESFAASKNVPRTAFADRTSTLAQKQQSGDVASLDLALNTVAAFRSSEMKKIIDALPQPSGASGGSTSVSIAQVKLVTRTAIPLKNEAEVDEYLANLKKSLMSKIEAGQEVMVD